MTRFRHLSLAWMGLFALIAAACANPIPTVTPAHTGILSEAEVPTPPYTPSPITLRVEPIIPGDLGDRVTGRATVFLDAPGAERVEVYAQPVDAPYSETPIADPKLIGVDNTPADGFAVPWAADEPDFVIKLYALAYLPGENTPVVSPSIWILLDWWHATETAIPEPTSTTLIYHGVTTHSWSTLWGLTGQADAIKAEVNAYEAAAGRTVAWVGFADEWQTDGRAFPSDVAISIRNRGATPLIFLSLRSIDVIDEAQQVEPLYTLDAIISGQFDSDFAAWADGAKSFGSEIIVDWGWEMNGDWAPWNGAYNGGPSEGPQRFQQAYRHIIELMRSRGASNIRWAFHVNFSEYPEEPWNAFENYYPGDDVIDIIGVSICSAQAPTDDLFPSFESMMDPAYSRLTQMAPEKPVYVFEFGAAAGNPLGSSVTWADEALAGILSRRWPAVRSFAWWNDYWSQDSNPAHDPEMRVEVAPGLATVFKSRLSGADNLGDRPPIAP